MPNSNESLFYIYLIYVLHNFSPVVFRSLPATMRSLASMMKLGKQRPPPEEDERKSLKDSDQLEYGEFQRHNKNLIIQ